MHHGYYVPENRTDHQQAQIDLIDEVLKWAGVTQATSVVDVGCGIGGSSRHIARKFNCPAQGITLSPYQANRGNELAQEQGLADQTKFQVSLSTQLCRAKTKNLQNQYTLVSPLQESPSLVFLLFVWNLLPINLLCRWQMP